MSDPLRDIPLLIKINASTTIGIAHENHDFNKLASFLKK